VSNRPERLQQVAGRWPHCGGEIGPGVIAELVGLAAGIGEVTGVDFTAAVGEAQFVTGSGAKWALQAVAWAARKPAVNHQIR